MYQIFSIVLLFISTSAYSCTNCDESPEMEHCQPCGGSVDVITKQAAMYIPVDFITNDKSGFVKFSFNLKKGKKPKNIEILEYKPINLPKGYFNQLIKNSTYTLDGAEGCVANQKFEVLFKFPVKSSGS